MTITISHDKPFVAEVLDFISRAGTMTAHDAVKQAVGAAIDETFSSPLGRLTAKFASGAVKDQVKSVAGQAVDGFFNSSIGQNVMAGLGIPSGPIDLRVYGEKVIAGVLPHIFAKGMINGSNPVNIGTVSQDPATNMLLARLEGAFNNFVKDISGGIIDISVKPVVPAIPAPPSPITHVMFGAPN